MLNFKVTYRLVQFRRKRYLILKQTESIMQVSVLVEEVVKISKGGE